MSWLFTKLEEKNIFQLWDRIWYFLGHSSKTGWFTLVWKYFWQLWVRISSQNIAMNLLGFKQNFSKHSPETIWNQTWYSLSSSTGTVGWKCSIFGTHVVQIILKLFNKFISARALNWSIAVDFEFYKSPAFIWYLQEYSYKNYQM